MPKPRTQSVTGRIGFDRACDLFESVLAGTTRQAIIDEALGSRGPGEALRILRTAMRAHTFRADGAPILLRPVVEQFDAATRKDGFKVLHDWDGKARKFNREIIPVDMLDYFGRLGAAGRPEPTALAILLDFYFVYILTLFVMRAWDEGDANHNLDRVTRLLDHLQGPNGSGLRMMDDAETLIWLGVSSYQPDDDAYNRLMERVRTLDEPHRLRCALIGSSILGCHLRWGFEAIYKRDLVLLRRDNVGDYPWLLFCVATLMKEYARLHDAGITGEARDRVVDALLNGLASDTPALVGSPSEALLPYRSEQEELAALYERYRVPLHEDFERQRPSESNYSPLAFHFNFPHNVLKARVGIALARGTVPNLSLNAIVTYEPAGGSTRDEREALARKLMDYGRASPERFGERRIMIIAYNLRVALSSFNKTLDEYMPEAAG